MNALLLIIILVLSSSAACGSGVERGTAPPDGAGADSTAAQPHVWSPPHHWLNVELALGRQSFGEGWSPYAQAAAISATVQRRIWESPHWLEGAITVAWAGELDAEGQRAGPGDSFVGLRSGVGRWWYPEDSQLAFYAGGGVTYTWAKMELPDTTRRLPISDFLGYSVYEDRESEGHFWGGYLRASVVVWPSDHWYLGIGALATVTTRRVVLDRMTDVNSFLLSIFFGGGD